MSKLNRQLADLRALDTQRKMMREVVSHEAQMVKSDLAPGSLVNRLLDNVSEKIEAVAQPAIDKGVELADLAMEEGEATIRNHPVWTGAVAAAAAFLMARPFLTERNGAPSDDGSEALHEEESGVS